MIPPCTPNRVGCATGDELGSTFARVLARHEHLEPGTLSLANMLPRSLFGLVGIALRDGEDDPTVLRIRFARAIWHSEGIGVQQC